MTVEDDHGQRPSSSPKKNENGDEQKKNNKKNQFLFDENTRPIKKVNRLCTVIAQ